MYAALFIIQTTLLFQLVLVAVAWEGRQLTLEGLLGIGFAAVFLSGPVGLLFLPLLLAGLVVAPLMLWLVTAPERRRRWQRHG